MIQKIYTGSDESILEETFTKGLGKLKFCHPVGTFCLTPASNILLKAIVENQEILHGIGIDWGSGVGCQAILAAKIDTVRTVFGLEISKDNINAAVINAEENGVGQKVHFIWADSYNPYNKDEKRLIQAQKGKVNFILSNPPSSNWDDGFGFRRMVLAGAKEFLAKNGVVLLNISFQYGADRIASLINSNKGFRYLGIAASTGCVPFDLSRNDLLDCLRIYSQQEESGGANYTFIENESNDKCFVNARTAMNRFERDGIIPFTKWQAHLFQYEG